MRYYKFSKQNNLLISAFKSTPTAWTQCSNALVFKKSPATTKDMFLLQLDFDNILGHNAINHVFFIDIGIHQTASGSLVY